MYGIQSEGTAGTCLDVSEEERRAHPEDTSSSSGLEVSAEVALPPGQCRNPLPTIVFISIIVLGAGTILLLSARLRLDPGVTISSLAALLTIVFVGEAAWDLSRPARLWITHEPRALDLPPWIARTKRFWPAAAFLVGIVIGHIWWW